jgi:putative chitinase
MINIERLRGVLPDKVVNQILPIAEKFGITTNLRLAHFLAQCAHESGTFTQVYENLNYSSAALKRVFPRYFPGNLADQYARKPEKIASRVYANRMGNGSEASGDGWTFRGRGYIQLTGKSNYSLFSKFIGEDCVTMPSLIANNYPLASAAFFFHINKLWSICDKGDSEDVVKDVTYRVNGGHNGLADRQKFFRIYDALLNKPV